MKGTKLAMPLDPVLNDSAPVPVLCIGYGSKL
jgi:hypothetical protein